MVEFMVPLGGHSAWGNNEVRYMLRSLEKYCKFSFNVTFFVNELIDWLKAEQIKVERYYPEKILKKNNGARSFENYYDVLNKVRSYASSGDGDFVYIYDDVCLLRDIEYEDIKNLSQNTFTKRSIAKHFNSRRWGKTLIQPHLLLGFVDYNYEHHLPMIYNKQKLRELFKRFPLEKTYPPYPLATMYFNMFPEEADEWGLVEYKVGFEGTVSKVACYNSSDVNEVVRGKTWLNYNDFGLKWQHNKQIPLMDWIENNYQDKSRFET